MFDQLYTRWFGQRKPRQNRARTQPLLRLPVNLTLERLEQREVLSNTPFPIGYFSLSPVVGAPGQTVTVTESVTLNNTPLSSTITGATWSAGSATFTTSGTNNYQAGYRVIVSGETPYGYNGVYNISTATSTSFVVPLATSPGAAGTTGAAIVGLVPNDSPAGSNTITAASWSSGNGGVATFTTSGRLSSSFASGASVTISGLTGAAAGYDGTFAISSAGTTSFTVPLEASSLAVATGLAGSANLNSVGYDFTAFQSLIGFDPTKLQVVGTPDTTAFDSHGNTLTNTAASTNGTTFAAADLADFPGAPAAPINLASQTANSTNGNTYGEVTLLEGTSGSYAYIPNGTYTIATFQVTIVSTDALASTTPLKVLQTSIDIAGVDNTVISGADPYNAYTQEALSFTPTFAPVNPTSIAVPNSVSGVDSALTVLPHAAAVPYDFVPPSLGTSTVLFNPATQAGLQTGTPNTLALSGITVTDGDYANGIGATTAITTVVTVSGSPLTGSSTTVGTLSATVAGSGTVTTVGGNGTSTLTITGSPADITATLATLVYTPGAGYYGTTTLTVATNNNGGGGSGGVFNVPVTDTRSTKFNVVGLFVSAVNTAKITTANPEQFVQLYSTVGSYKIPANTYLLGVSGKSTTSAALGLVTDVFNFSGLTTGANGFLTLEEAGTTLNSTLGGIALANQGGTGFGSNTSSAYSENGTSFTAIHTGSTRPSGQLSTDIYIGAESFLLIESATAPVAGTTSIATTTPAAWNIDDSVGTVALSGTTKSYAAVTFGLTGTTVTGSTVIATPSYLANYVARIASDTGYSSAAWLGSVAASSGNSTYPLSLSTTQSTSFAGAFVPKVAEPNLYAPQETVILNDGTYGNEHSQVGELTIDFTTPVNISSLAGAFTLTDSSTATVPITVTAPNGATTGAVTGVTSVVITFDASTDVFTFANGDALTDNNTGNQFFTGLVDGNYFLKTTVADVTYSNNGTSYALDGANNGVPGSTTTGSGQLNGGGTYAVNEFWRLFGDVSGTRTVDAQDTYAFLQAQGSVANGLGDSVSAVAYSNGHATLTLANTGDYATVGETVTITGINVASGEASTSYNGTFVITAIAGTPGNITSISYATSAPASGPYDLSNSGVNSVSTGTYAWYLDVNVSGYIDVGNTTSQSAFFANEYGSSTFAGIGNYGTKTLAP